MAYSEIFEFTGAVRGFHVYRKVWKPTEGQRLACFYESGNVFDPFAVKSVKRIVIKPLAIYHEKFQESPNLSLTEVQLSLFS